MAFVEFDKTDPSSGLVRLKEAKAAEIVAQHEAKGLLLSEDATSSVTLSMPTEGKSLLLLSCSTTHASLHGLTVSLYL